VHRKICIVLVLGLAACSKDSKNTPAATTPGVGSAPSDLRARCEKFVTKAEALGETEKESTHAEKVDFCVSEAPPASLMDCVERAADKAAAQACK